MALPSAAAPRLTHIEDSDAISYTSYRDGILVILFIHGGLYAYRNVPPAIYHGLLGAASRGHYFRENIQAFPQAFPFTRLDMDALVACALAAEVGA